LVKSGCSHGWEHCLSNSVVDACTVNAFKARLDKFWQHQAVKFDFTADLELKSDQKKS